MREFAEQEIIVPDGKYKGEPLRLDRQPVMRAWFDEIDTGRWNRYALTAPTQTGKTFAGLIIPLMYYVFEMGETVICGIPKIDMARDKWELDIKPTIEASNYRDLLPVRGMGSQGGRASLVQFRNGASLRFMTGGGDDKTRSSFTSRILMVTEVDGMDEAGGNSRESDKIEQLEGRVRSYNADERQIFLECTASVTEGRIWQEYIGGSATRVWVRCPLCNTYISPEREHLTGWHEADTKGQSRRNSWYFCPSCGEKLNEDKRRAAHDDIRLVHDGQTIDAAGNVVGDLPDTDTLGFRWNAFNNLFLTAGDIGQDEWAARRAVDEDSAAKKINQFVWALPWDPDNYDMFELKIDDVMKRLGPNRKGIVPKGTQYLTASFDLGQRAGSWWQIWAWLGDGRGHLVDYGNLKLDDVKKNGLKKSLLAVMNDFKSIVESGWPTAEGDSMIPEAAWMDAGWMPDLVQGFCKSAGDIYSPIVGLGAGQHHNRTYRRPNRKTRDVLHLGEEYHTVRRNGVTIFELNSDYWKTQLQSGLHVEPTAAGAITIYDSPDKNEHRLLSRHFTAERPIEKTRPGQPPLLVWERLHRDNHYLDCGMIGCASGHYVADKRRRAAAGSGQDWWGKQGRRRA